MTIANPLQVIELIGKGHSFLCDNELLIDMVEMPVMERMDEFEQFNLSCCGKSSKINFISEEMAKSFPSRSKNWYSKTIWLEFENIMVPVPAEYDAVLTGLYGNWKEPVKGGSMHDGIILEPDIPYYLYK